MTPLFVLPLELLVVLASSNSDDQPFCVSVSLCRPPPHQDWGRAETAGSRFARDDKELGPQLTPAGGKNYPHNGLVKPPRRDTRTRALSPAGARFALPLVRYEIFWVSTFLFKKKAIVPLLKYRKVIRIHKPKRT